MKKGLLSLCLLTPLLVTGCKHTNDDDKPWVMSHHEYAVQQAENGEELPELSTIEHIVLFKLKPSVTHAEKTAITQRFLALKDSSRDGEPYIKGIEYGYQNSLEGLAKGYELGFIVTFRNADDRNYYVGTSTDKPFDQQHALFKQFVAPFVDDVLVFDFNVHG